MKEKQREPCQIFISSVHYSAKSAFGRSHLRDCSLFKRCLYFNLLRLEIWIWMIKKKNHVREPKTFMAFTLMGLPYNKKVHTNQKSFNNNYTQLYCASNNVKIFSTFLQKCRGFTNLQSIFWFFDLTQINRIFSNNIIIKKYKRIPFTIINYFILKSIPF